MFTVPYVTATIEPFTVVTHMVEIVMTGMTGERLRSAAQEDRLTGAGVLRQDNHTISTKHYKPGYLPLRFTAEHWPTFRNGKPFLSVVERLASDHDKRSRQATLRR